MSVMRLLNHTKQTMSASAGRIPTPTGHHSNRDIQLVLDVPGYGGVHLRRPEPEETRGLEGQHTNAFLRGILRVSIPIGCGRKRVKGIRVYLRTVSIIDMGTGRHHEEDVLFERGVDIAAEGQNGAEDDGIWLDEGTQLFSFSIIIPEDIAPHNRITSAVVRHVLHAQVYGPIPSHSWNLLHSFRPRSPSVHTFAQPKPRSGSFTHSQLISRPSSITPPPSVASRSRRSSGAVTPAEDEPSKESSDGTEDCWLKGTITASREIMIVYNPSPTNEVSTLNVNFDRIVQPWCRISLKFDSPSVRPLQHTPYTLLMSPHLAPFPLEPQVSQGHR